MKIFSSNKSSPAESEWQQLANTGQETTVLFLQNAARYCKFVVEIDAKSDISNANFLLLVQIEISEIISPYISDHTRSILSRFPSWTKIYGDSIERATPETALPRTTAGKLVNAIIGEDFDDVDVMISRIELDSFIGLSDKTQPAWLYVYSSIKPGFIKVLGDSIELARVSSMRELLEHRDTDWVFYYNFLTSQLYTLRKINNLNVDDIEYKSDVVQNLNSFDEFGLKVGLQRLYLESNANFRLRILDVYQNPPAINAENFKKTLRRELDIWRAFNSTPDSNYVGATPEILEISDIEKDSKYFSNDQIPTQEFRDFVEYINSRYPSNLGYIKWGESYWDPAGKRVEGFSQIPQITDSATSDYYIEEYQQGIGDFNDIKIKLEKLDYGIQNYSIGIRAGGVKKDGIEKAHEPIDIVYDTYISYREDYIDNDTATISYDVTFNLSLHGNVQDNSVYTAKYETLAKNEYDASVGEYISKSVFNPSGFTNGESIYYDSAGTPYVNTVAANATESYTFTEIPLFAVKSMQVNFISAKNSTGTTGNYGKIGFLDSVPSTFAQQNSTSISKTSNQINDSVYATKLKIISNINDNKKTRILNTPKIRSNRFGNKINISNDISKKSDLVIQPSDLIRDFVLPNGAIPLYVHVENVVEDSYDIDTSSSPYQGYGGISLNKNTGKKYLLSSQDNIRFHFINPNFSTPHLHDHYIDTTNSSTINYQFINVKFPYFATPNFLSISATPSAIYPFDYTTWTSFSADYNKEIKFSISDDGIISSLATSNYDLQNNNTGFLVGSFDFRRSDFGLGQEASSPETLITSLSAINENDDIYVYLGYVFPMFDWTSDFASSAQLDYLQASQYLSENDATPYGLLNYYDPILQEYISKGIEISAIPVTLGNERIHPTIESGHIYQNGTPYYLYADSALKSTSYNESEILLDSVARQGAPIIVKVNQKEYAQVSFTDEANPTELSYHNIEYIKAVHDDHLALAYSNVFDVSILDTYTGEIIVENESSSSNILIFYSINNPTIKSGNTYKVKYRVKDTFSVDNQYYYEFDKSYRTKVSLLSTPNNIYVTDIEYEHSIFDSDIIYEDISLNPLYSSINEGYIYLADKEYPMQSVNVKISPKEILDNNSELMALSIFSKDVNGNPKPYIPYVIGGNNILAYPNPVTTDVDGYALAYVDYIGNSVATPSSGYIYVSGLYNEEYNSGPLTSATVNYYIKPVTTTYEKLSAEVTKKIINADGQEAVNIYGSATPNAKVYWRRGRNLFEAFNTQYSNSSSEPGQDGISGMVTANDLGEFIIGPYRAQNDATPGYWFVAVDTEMSTLPQVNPNTVAGDIVYWYERYDVNQSNSSEAVLSAYQGANANYYHYLTDSSFKKDFETQEVYYEDVFQNTWNLPKWYPISRYTQYQMGLLSATPYLIETYENLHPDYEEE